MKEPIIHVPAWSQKRRITTTAILVVFILLSASFIGAGVYQIGIQTGKIPAPITKQTILSSLLGDAGFYRAVKHSLAQRPCSNSNQQVSLSYSAPLHPMESLTPAQQCLHFVATHPTGRTVIVSLEKKAQSRQDLVNTLSKSFSTVQTEILSGTAHETSSLTGFKDGVSTQLFVIEINSTASWVVSYAPTSPLLDKKVLDLVLSFRSDHK